MWLDTCRVDAYYSGAFGMDAEHIDGVLSDSGQYSLGVLNVYGGTY